ncbi:sigma-70 family RNA polymerase sigma factor [Amycolatopsis jejuensis]|uniref:sigma-70 family RNA polymerase sigma factor n=1 Tax=Amycolatopsis jejuensis TaxID=330084 RepID=UPI000526D232|nr:sigma-70 family RNA polymerase sigma factor [Amycolatopsis jejuensis]
MTDGGEFTRLASGFRPELLGYCYRMLGSLDEAEDVVQETYLRAWRAYAGFEGRSSLRSWLYRIAANACWTALEKRGRRPLPSGLGGPSTNPQAVLAKPEVSWLQPLPEVVLNTMDPAAIVAGRGSLRLALVAAWQHLPARQRAVLILRDVMAWRAAEVAEALEMTPTAVKSALQRAREHLKQVAPAEHNLVEPADARVRTQLDGFMTAFETADVNALTRLLREDVELEMPPYSTWFAGRTAVVQFLETRVLATGAKRTVATRANGQPAIAVYAWEDGAYRAHAIHVLTCTDTGIARIVAFLDPALFGAFELPLERR